MKTKLIIAGIVASIILGGSALTVFAQNQNTKPTTPPSSEFTRHPKQDPAVRDAIQKAIEAGNYEQWKTLITEQNPNAPILDKITSENFPRYVQMHQLIKEAREKMQQADAIRKELGIEKHWGFKGKMGRGGGRHMLNKFQNQK